MKPPSTTPITAPGERRGRPGDEPWPTTRKFDGYEHEADGRAERAVDAADQSRDRGGRPARRSSTRRDEVAGDPGPRRRRAGSAEFTGLRRAHGFPSSWRAIRALVLVVRGDARGEHTERGRTRAGTAARSRAGCRGRHRGARRARVRRRASVPGSGRRRTPAFHCADWSAASTPEFPPLASGASRASEALVNVFANYPAARRETSNRSAASSRDAF